MASRLPATLPLPPATATPHPPGALGALWLRPQGAPFKPLSKWPRAQRVAELARVDRALAALAAPRDAADLLAPGPLLAVGDTGRDVAKKSLEKYRRRLVRALAPGRTER